RGTGVSIRPGGLRMLTQDQKERELYESRFKKLHDDNYWERYPEIMKAEARVEERAKFIRDYQQLLGMQLTPLDQLMATPAETLLAMADDLQNQLAQKLAAKG